MSIGQVIKVVREERGLTQSQFAHELFVTQQALSRWDVFCQVVIGQCGVSFPSEKAVGFSPVRNWPVIARVLLFHCIRA